MTDIYTWDFTVEVTLRSNHPGISDTIRVGCVGVGSAGDRTFRRGEFHVGYYKHDPYSLVARQWFDDHPVPAKVWKVGDIVPRDTAIGKWWTAAPFRTAAQVPTGGDPDYGTKPSNVGPDQCCRGERTILWIEP